MQARFSDQIYVGLTADVIRIVALVPWRRVGGKAEEQEENQKKSDKLFLPAGNKYMYNTQAFLSSA